MADRIDNIQRHGAPEPGAHLSLCPDCGKDPCECPPKAVDPNEKLSGQERKKVLEKVEDWWMITREAHAENRIEQRVDADFYDHIQWTEEDLAILRERRQAPLVFNKVAQAVNWVIGTERRAQVDFSVFPRTEDDVKPAQVKEDLLKYISDTSRAPHQRSKQFADAIKVGVGWIEEGVLRDNDEEPVFVRHERWGNVWWDPHSRADDLDDCRFLFRSKWLDLDLAKELFPKHARALQDQATLNVFANSETSDEDFDLPALFQHVDHYGRTKYRATYSGIVDAPRKARQRVRIIECWYRKPRRRKRIWSRDSFQGEDYSPDSPHYDAMQKEVHDGIATLTDAITLDMCVAVFIPGTLLFHATKPYDHNRFPLTPLWCYRRDRDGMPYGMIRGVRDAQMDLNKRLSKSLWAVSSNQTLYETTAIEDIDEWRREVAKPDGMLRVKDGSMQQKRVEVLRNNDVAQGNIDLMQINSDHIYDGSGVNRESLGYESNAQSGKAIRAKQSEGQLTTAEPFDNLALAMQISGEKTLSLIEQFMAAEKQIRITGTTRKEPYRFLKLNEPTWDPETGEWTIENDITATKADFVVDQQDFRQSMRAAMVEELMEIIRNLPPEAGLPLFALAAEMTDLPQKDEIARVIREISGIPAPDEDPDSAEAQARAAQQAEMAEQEARMLALEEARTTADTRKTAADAEHKAAQAVKTQVESQLTAVDVHAAEQYFNSEDGSAGQFFKDE